MSICMAANCHPKPEDVTFKQHGDDFWLEFVEPNSAYGQLSIYLAPGVKAAILQALSEVPDA